MTGEEIAKKANAPKRAPISDWLMAEVIRSATVIVNENIKPGGDPGMCREALSGASSLLTSLYKRAKDCLDNVGPN